MRFLLDTGTCVAVLSGNRFTVAHLSQTARADVALFSLTVAALRLAVGHMRARRARRELEVFLEPFEVLAFDAQAAAYYVKVCRALDRSHRPVAERDAIAAATALAHNLTLVTTHPTAFRGVPGLRVEDWGR